MDISEAMDRTCTGPGDAPSPAGFISTTSMNFMLPGTS